MCCIFTKDLPWPHVVAVHTPNSDARSSGHLSEAQSLQTAAYSETTGLPAKWKCRYRQKSSLCGLCKGAGDIDSGSAQSWFCECNLSCTSWKRWLFLVLLVRGRCHPFIQITLFSLPRMGKTVRNTVSPFIVTAVDLPGILIADFFSVLLKLILLVWFSYPSSAHSIGTSSISSCWLTWRKALGEGHWNTESSVCSFT